ncbi:MAG: hypothetical protein MUP49_07525 [Dehalococcoidia bacterium]|nr:hypothetical protein [Dehalococcoidia bacterium]
MEEHIRLDTENTDMTRWLLLESEDSSGKTVSEETNAEGQYYCVLHTISIQRGRPLVRIGRIYKAKSPEDALRKYLTVTPIHESGFGEDCVALRLSGRFDEGYQEFEAFKMHEDENCLTLYNECTL